MAKLKAVVIDGRQYFTTGGRVSKPRRQLVAHLLPNYDEFFIGHRDRSAISARLRKAGSRLPEGSLFWNVIALDGQLVGGWRRVPKRKGIVIELRLVTPLKSNERKAVAAAADDYARFLGAGSSVTFI